MQLTRRSMLAACAGAATATDLWAGDQATTPRTQLGVVIHSYGLRSGADKGFTDPLTFVDYCARLGAGGAQVAIGARDKDYIVKLRAKVEASKMHLEGSIRLPQDRADVERFGREIATAKEAGVTVLRSAIGGRRYEIFDTAAAFRTFADRAYQSLTLAEPVVARADARLAVENHKDFRADELIAMLKRLSSKHVGACIDTGNSIALLEEPMETVRALASWAMTTHIKDMGVSEYEDGFLLAEVPFGKGFLDLAEMVRVLRQARPQIRFNVEMITRDPLRVPCLTDKYWATLATVPAAQLARTLRMVRRHAAKEPLPRVSGLTTERKLAAEDDNVRQCLTYARERLGL